MTEAVSWIEITIPEYVPGSPDKTQTYRFAIDSLYLPASFAAIPSIRSIEFQPAILSLGGDLGQRGGVTVTLKDHRHVMAAEAVASGSFWGKFRARYGVKLRGKNLTVYQGTTQNLTQEARHFLIDSTDGPNGDGQFKIIGKDVLKLADGDRAQCPVLSNGFLAADITNVATAATLSPAGIGNTEYPASGTAAIGGSEIVTFTRAGDALTITRAQHNTVGVAHTAGDRVQLCKLYTGQDVANIIADLLITFSGIASGYIPIFSWLAETAAFLGTVYTAVIAEPTSVNQLVSELIEQAGLVIWWDDIGQQIRLQVIRQIPTGADVYNEQNTLIGSLEVAEQLDRRLSQIYFYFAKINPLVADDQIDNYRSTALTRDAQAEIDYGGAAIKKIFSRWVPTGGRTVAETASRNLLSRFVNPPRRVNFDLLRYSVTAPALGGGYQLRGYPFQDTTGVAVSVPIQVTSINPRADRFQVEAEEMLFTAIAGGGGSPDQHQIVIDANVNNINLKTMHDSIYASSPSGTTVTCTIYAGVIVGSTSAANPAFDIGTWGAGVTINLIVLGRIQGMGGRGGDGGVATFATSSSGTAGGQGGTALYTRHTVNLTSTAGEIWGGGGGGGGGAGAHTGSAGFGGDGGSGGAGTNGGAAGIGGFGSTGVGPIGNPGTATAGGAGVVTTAGDGGPGGGPGLAGGAGIATGTASGGAAGAAGTAIDGDSFVTDIGGVGDIRGPQVN